MNYRDKVIEILSYRSQVAKDNIADSLKLQEAPLSLTSLKLTKVAYDIRIFIKEKTNNTKSFYKSEISASRRTVAEVIEKVNTKINGV